MAYEVEFNGINLSGVCTVLGIKRSVLPNRDNFTQVIPTVNGSYYTGFRYGEKTITLDVYIVGRNPQEYTQNIAKLANVLNTSAPCILKLSDEPDVYYKAILNGGTELTKTVKSGQLSIEFICHDPYAYSKNWFTSMPNDRGVLNFINNGTANSLPIVDATFKNKSCFFQITNQSGETVLIGKPKELDKPTQPESDVLVDDNCQSTAGFATLSPSLLPNGVAGGGNYGVGIEGNAITCSNYGSGDGWHGASFKKVVGQDLEEFEVTVDFIMSAQGKNYVTPAPEPLPPVAPPNESGTCLGTYKVVNCGGLWVNRDANDSTPLFAMAPNTLIYPDKIQGNWYHHTTKTSTTTITGWSYGKYLKKVSDSGRADRAEEYGESQVGMLDIYGYDRNGTRLFRMWNVDASEWFESIDPHLFIGDSMVLEEDAMSTNPRQEAVGEGDNIEYQNAVSGAVGRWNDWNGKLVIRREKNSAGQFLWSASIYKTENGRVVATLSTQNSLCSSNYPAGALNYLGFYIGGYGQNANMSVMGITHVKVRKLNIKAGVDVSSNISLFEAGDKLQVNFNSGDVLLNGQSILEKLDIGSKFFNIPSGESRIITRSDDKQVVVCAGIQEKFI